MHRKITAKLRNSYCKIAASGRNILGILGDNLDSRYKLVSKTRKIRRIMIFNIETSQSSKTQRLKPLCPAKQNC